MDGPFWVDTRAPHISADVPAVTLAGTNKALVPIANLPVLGSNYFGYVGKLCRVTMFGRISTGATPGTGTFSILWGNGADANGTVLASSAGFSLGTTQTNCSWECKFLCRCRALGATGSLIVSGYFEANPLVVSSTLQPLLIPATAPAAVTVDLTAANVLSPQFSRSGSTAESMQVHEFIFESLN